MHRVGEQVNLEADILAKYMERMLAAVVAARSSNKTKNPTKV